MWRASSGKCRLNLLEAVPKIHITTVETKFGIARSMGYRLQRPGKTIFETASNLMVAMGGGKRVVVVLAADNAKKAFGRTVVEIDKPKQAVAKRDGQLVQLRSALTTQQRAVRARDSKIARLEQAVAKRDGQIAHLNHTIAACNARIAGFENSRSWRVTRPLRFTAHLIRVVLDCVRRTEGLTGLPVGPHYVQLSDGQCLAVPFAYTSEKLAKRPTIAVICHIYYTDLADEIKRYISNIPFHFDLFITTDSKDKKSKISKSFVGWNKGRVEIRLAPNQGFDIAPRLIRCADVYERYEFSLLIHSKKSPQAPKLAHWRSYLLETLLGSKEIVASIFEAFCCDPKLGIIAPEHYDAIWQWIGWGINFDLARKYARRLGFKLLLNGKIDFPSGSMFWARSACLLPLVKCGLSVQEFARYGGNSQRDGTLGHVIERLFFFACERAGYRWIKIARPTFANNHTSIISVKNRASLAKSIAKIQYDLLVSTNGKSTWLNATRAGKTQTSMTGSTLGTQAAQGKVIPASGRIAWRRAGGRTGPPPVGFRVKGGNGPLMRREAPVDGGRG